MDLGGFCICYSVKHFTYFDTNIVTIPIFSTLDPFFAFNSQTMSWASPDSNCSFSYVVNSTSNGSLVAQHRTNTTSLTVTDLSVATMYHFAVAVESKKRVQRRKNWYSNDIGIKICEMFHTITYTKST